MVLPPYNPNIYWKKFAINTPTLELRPFEKSDMSPFLVHMTNGKSVKSILENKKINATTPSQSKSDWYDKKIVCFTETPIFAIDFFRYKKIDRWKNDLRYGIGFSKKALADKGVRPALYIDNVLIGLIAELKGRSSETKAGIVYSAFAPLITPLDHDKDAQGFMWEREWRYPDENGFDFQFDDIKIICCPREEVSDLIKILGAFSNNITFLETWGEYDEVTKYLESRRNSNEMRLVVNSSGIDELKSAYLELSQELSKLEAYKTQIDRLHAHSSMIEEELPNIQNKIKIIQQRIARQEWFETHCCKCHYPFKDTIKPAFGNDEVVERSAEWELEENMQTWICIDCKTSFLRGA